jgi:hypothetical protein
MTNQVDQWLSKINSYQYNPAGIQQSMIAGLREITDGRINIVDPTNPVVFQLECSAMCAAAAISESRVLTRQQYASAAQTADELYLHMSDKDFVDRFAIPSTVDFMFFFRKDELLNKMVQDADDASIRKIIIPRDSFIEVADMTFGLQYPIVMRQMAHGGLQIVYDVEQVSPLQNLSTNRIDYLIRKDDTGTEYVSFTITLQQFSIQSLSEVITKGQPFEQTFTVVDQYYYTRVWIDNADGTFTELVTTHTDDVYDPLTPTATLRLAGDQLTIKIPQVYVNTGLVAKSVRMDVYQTKGPLDINMSNYSENQLKMSFRGLNPAEENIYSAPMSALQVLLIHAPGYTTGGRNEMTFEELRKRVITNSVGNPSVPITPAQIEAVLERNGYKIVKNIDQITNRAYLATSPMPDPVNTDLITAAAAGISTWPARLTDVVLLDTVTDNGPLITVHPSTLYRWKNGVVEAVPSNEVAFLKALPSDQLANAVNTDNFLYSPFTYVLDTEGNEFNLRPYYLDSPAVTGRTFVAENDSTGLQVSTDTIQVVRDATGYKLRLYVKSSEAYKALADSQVKIQLAYTPRGEATYAYLLGTQVGLTTDSERIFEFDLSMNDAINSSHELNMTKFQMFTTADRVTTLPLDTEFDILHSTNSATPPQWQTSEIDALLGRFQLPVNSRAMTHEKVRVQFGNYLEHLWARSRTIVSANVYEKWAVDVPATYENDVYAVDPETGLEFMVVGGTLEWDKLHAAGDPILDNEGEPVLKHKAGDVKLDAYGNPIVIRTRELLRHMSFFLVEGSYYFATNQVTTDYRQKLVETVVRRLINDMEGFDRSLLERTNIYYYPTTTTGSVEVMYNNGLVSSIQAGQGFEITLYAGESVYSNTELRDAIQKKTIRTLSTQLANRRVAISDIVDALRSQYGNDIMGVDVSKLGGAAQLAIVTMVDDSKRLALRKRLVSRNDATLALEEDVTFTWVLHQRDGLIV